MRAKPIVTTLFVGSLVIAAVVGTHMLAQKGDASGQKHISSPPLCR
jgi:hypothetical protein